MSLSGSSCHDLMIFSTISQGVAGVAGLECVGSGVVVVSSGVVVFVSSGVVVGLGVVVGSAVVGSAGSAGCQPAGGSGHCTPAHKRYFQSYLISDIPEICLFTHYDVYNRLQFVDTHCS